MVAPTRILKVKADATKKEIDKAYRLAALQCHPDKKNGSHKQFLDLQIEYKRLIDQIESKSENVGSNAAVQSYDHANNRIFSKPKNVIEHQRVTTFKMKFNSDASNEEKVTAIFSGIKNHFGFSIKNEKVDASKPLFTDTKKQIGIVSFLGSKIKRITRTITRRKEIANNPLLTGSSHEKLDQSENTLLLK